MSSKELNAVLSAVRKLTAAERRFVVKLIRQLDGVELSASGYSRHSDDWLLPGLEYELRRRGVLLVPLSPDKLGRWAPNYVRDSAEIRKALKEKLNKTVNQAELLALGRMCARSLADYLIARAPEGLTLGPKMLLGGINETAVALNKAFPGYLAGGQLAVLLQIRAV